MSDCFEKCERLSDEAFYICVEHCYKYGDYDGLRIKMAYARALAESVDNWW